MKTIHDVQQLLMRHGAYVYTGDRIGDLELLEMEICDLHESKLVGIEEYRLVRLLIAREKRLLGNKK